MCFRGRPSRSVLGRALILLAALLTAACQPLFQPFQFDHETYSELALPPPEASNGLLVLPIHGVNPPLDRALAAALAQALRERDVPASLESANPGSFMLSSNSRQRLTAGGEETEVLLSWRLTNSEGELIGGFEDSYLVKTRQWAGGEGEAMMEIAEPAADRISEFLLGVARTEEPIPSASSWPRLVVAPIADAPGQGGPALQDAMEAELTRAGAIVTGAMESDTLGLLADIVVLDTPPGEKTLDIVWRLVEPNGDELGRVSQSGPVPDEVLLGDWTDLAPAIAGGAVGGVLDLLERVQLSE
ncbi:MAG: hypothetical protein V3V17_09140 [Alphaproteobacteria bacterium]